ncbi:MAG: multiheme c-type cytochrome [Fidelibacterota bacterium]
MTRILVIVLMTGGILWSQDFEYVGSQNCKICHSSSKRGAQYKVWEESAHARAFDTLKGDKAAEIVKEMRLEVVAEKAPECLVCHTTGFGRGGYEVKDEAFWNPDPEDRKARKAARRMAGLQAVGCEACHGPGSEYKSKKTMEAIYGGTVEAASVGLEIPDEKTCQRCHNEKSPTFKGFKFEEYVKKIIHPDPAELKQD